MTIEKLLEYIRRTNPAMTRKQLIEELKRMPSSATCLALIVENIDKHNI